MKAFNGQNLLGAYAVDAEGVRPVAELVLVDQGVLKTLYNGRIPTPKVPASNGHNRAALSGGEIESVIGPGVMVVSSSKTASYEKLKKMLIEKARSEDLDYAIIVKKLASPNAGFNRRSGFSFATGEGNDKEPSPRPLWICKISTKDGSEQPVRSAALEGLGLRALKRLLGAANQQLAYNTLITSGDRGGWGWGGSQHVNGIPATLIVPQAVLLEELDVNREKRAAIAKLPLTPNPVGK
jgi:hypothetical protein